MLWHFSSGEPLNQRNNSLIWVNPNSILWGKTQHLVLTKQMRIDSIYGYFPFIFTTSSYFAPDCNFLNSCLSANWDEVCQSCHWATDAGRKRQRIPQTIEKKQRRRGEADGRCGRMGSGNFLWTQSLQGKQFVKHKLLLIFCS